jgi:hypothetical protein
VIIRPDAGQLMRGHAGMRSAEPDHQAGAQHRHTPAFNTPYFSARGNSLAPMAEPPPAPAVPLTAPAPVNVPVERTHHVTLATNLHQSQAAAAEPRTAGRMAPRYSTGRAIAGETEPTSHLQAIHTQASSQDIQAAHGELSPLGRAA